MQVLIRWGIQRGTSTILKATTVSHLKSNLEAANWELPPEDYKALNFLGYQVCPSLRPLCIMSENGAMKRVQKRAV